MLPIFFTRQYFWEVIFAKACFEFFYPEIKSAKISFFQRHQRSISLIKIKHTLNPYRVI
jgi:hypothetical protein